PSHGWPQPECRQRAATGRIDACRNDNDAGPYDARWPLAKSRNTHQRCYCRAKWNERGGLGCAPKPDSAALERKGDRGGQHGLIKRLENQVRGRLGEQIIPEKGEVDWQVE